jgi:hypothetical protein
MHRLLLIAVIVLFQFQVFSYGKPPKRKETEGLAYATFQGQPTPSKETLSDLLHQARWDNADWDVANSQGLKLRFDKVDDQVTPKGTFARYRVYAEGAARNKVYEWRVWRPGQETKSDPGDLYLNARGLLMTHRPRPEEELSLQVPAGEFYITPEGDPAEPVRYDLHSRDNDVSVLGSLVPQPVLALDHGCTLEVRIAQANAAALLFLADGLPSDTQIPLVLESEGETANLMMDTDAGGRAIVADFPYVTGKKQGILKATAEGPDCLPSVSLPWKAEASSAQATSPAAPADQTPPAKKKPWYLPPLPHK